ncbi:ribonuclease HII [Veillonella denticariosi JCM 15641]|uniref:Ribonuclease HII n=1 Tax=Veillonella denticariosi JCM 15641 TaxID=1298594 RepID=A0A2S7Z7D5_9FIRM|nr:ribonuclease HII [Veillonella denticariosi]PQL19161.1 ribonuclease HII [Veillonella denticariosi JCM 15641]
MDKIELSDLKVQDIKALFETDKALDILPLAQADSRSFVQKLAAAYIKRQEKELKEQQRLMGMYDYEGIFYDQDLYHVAGVDEVGRGPIAGPVTVAAVILPPMTLIPGLNDSKKLTEEKREALYDIITKEAVAISCVSYGPEKIDELNIYEATRQAMYEAVRTLSVPAEAVVVDAMKLPDLTVPVESIIKGDSKSANIAAASIIAKVTRDRYMKRLDEEYPGYGFGIHKGYYTELHKEAVEQQGVTPLHRKSFEPIKSIVGWVKE